MAAIDTQYVPAITDSRRLAQARVEAVADRLGTPADASWFLLSFLALRVGPLRRIPEWFQSSAAGCMAGHPDVAVDLFETARLERSQQLVLLEDLVELRLRTPGVDFGALIRRPFEPRIEQHLRVRKLVPTGSVPIVVLAIDLELTLLERDGGAVLLDACRSMLGPVGCEFLRLRQRAAERRIHTRLSQLRGVLDEPSKHSAGSWAGSWATIASKVLLSYVDTLDACADRRARRASAPHASPQRPACVW